MRHTWICSYEILQQLKKNINDNVTYLSGKDEIICCNIDLCLLTLWVLSNLSAPVPCVLSNFRCKLVKSNSCLKIS